MNVRLKKVFNFAAGIVYNNAFSINDYTVTVKFTTVTSDPAVHNIVYERMCYWIDQVLFNSIMIAESDPMLDRWLATEQRVIVLPEAPVDQIVGLMIFSKFSAIVDNSVIISELELSSGLGGDVIYCHSINEQTALLSEPGWWNDPKPTWASNTKPKVRGNKVIKLNRVPECKDLDLDFESVPNDDVSKPVVFVDFSKND